MIIRLNPIGKQINEYLMRMAPFVALWYLLEVVVKELGYAHLLFSALTLPMMCFTPFFIGKIIVKLRKDWFCNVMTGFQAWTFGVQCAFYAALIEAFVLYIYNAFLDPSHLATAQAALIAQYETAYRYIEQTHLYDSALPKFQETLDMLKDTPVPSAIDESITLLSNEIFLAMIFMVPTALVIRKKDTANLHTAS